MCKGKQQIFMPTDIKDMLYTLMGYPNEFSGLLIAERRKNGLIVFYGELDEGTEDKGSPWRIPGRIEGLIASNSERYTLVPAHSHSRRFGEVIDIIDPYWSANKELAGDYERGTVVDNFFISRKQGGDSLVAEHFHKSGIDFHIFAHPAHGSEGQRMSRDKIRITAYKYNPSSIGRVREVPLIYVPMLEMPLAKRGSEELPDYEKSSNNLVAA